MPEEAPTTQGIIPDLSNAPLVQSEDGVFEAYANVINFNWTLTDVRIRFGELVYESTKNVPATWKDQETAIMERAAITVPWQQVKYLAVTLGTLLKNYEDLNGEIKQTKLPSL
jgi:hypothetical protein